MPFLDQNCPNTCYAGIGLHLEDFIEVRKGKNRSLGKKLLNGIETMLLSVYPIKFSFLQTIMSGARWN